MAMKVLSIAYWIQWNLSDLGQKKVSILGSCPDFRGCYVQTLIELIPEDVSLLER